MRRYPTKIVLTGWVATPAGWRTVLVVVHPKLMNEPGAVESLARQQAGVTGGEVRWANRNPEA